ncbi:hypothetical protein OSTOST_07276 [Ostertagia ostertagi]
MKGIVPGWGANMFTIVDRKNNKAISYISALGSKFGSGVSINDSYYLNDFGRYKTSHHDILSGLLPAVAKSGPSGPKQDLLNKKKNPTKAPDIADEAVSVEVIDGGHKLVAAHKNVKERYSLIPSGI